MHLGELPEEGGTMRNPKFGDRCEYAVFNQKTMRKKRVCEVRHLQGTPPGLLMPLKQDRETVLMCNQHALVMCGDWSGQNSQPRRSSGRRKGTRTRSRR